MPRYLRVALALAVTTGLILAGTVARASAGDPLELVGTPQIDRTGILLASKWTSITGSGATWDPDNWRGEFRWTIPSSIPPGGANASLYVKATDKAGGRFNAVMGVSGNLFIENGPAVVEALADKIAGPATKEASKSFRLVPGSYCDGCAISVTVGIQDGPRITFNYKVVPKRKPCPGRKAFTIAQVKGPLICNTDEPGPGKGTTLSSPPLNSKDKDLKVNVSSSAGNLNGTTIVGEAEVKATRAERIGAAVAGCYMIGTDAFDYPKATIKRALLDLVNSGEIHLDYVDSPSGRLKICIALARTLVGTRDDTASARAAARGCHTKRIAFAPRVRRGKVVGLKLAKSQRPSGSSVRYTCAAGRRGSVTLTARRRQGLRNAVGKRLDLGVVRALDAPARDATLTFGFR